MTSRLSNHYSVVESKVRIMVFGTFDIVHPGHRHFFRQARLLAGDDENAYLIVSLARSSNAERIKGKTLESTERQRLDAVSAAPEVDRAVLGAIGNHIPHIVREKPDIIALGYDQEAYVDGLASALAREGINPRIVRLEAFKPHIHKTSIIQAKKRAQG